MSCLLTCGPTAKPIPSSGRQQAKMMEAVAAVRTSSGCSAHSVFCNCIDCVSLTRVRERNALGSVCASLLQERLQAQQLELQQQLSAAHLREAQAARKVAEASAALAEARVTVRHEVEQELFVQKEAVRRDRLALESERWALWRGGLPAKAVAGICIVQHDRGCCMCVAARMTSCSLMQPVTAVSRDCQEKRVAALF